MPKIKNNKGAAKRFTKTAGGVKCKHSHLRHILTKKNADRKRYLRGGDMVEKSDLASIRKLLPS